MMQWWMWADGTESELWSRDMVQDFFSSIPLTEINMSLRRDFLMFLHGCMLPHAVAVIGPSSVIKCMSMPYFDRAVMEFIYYTRCWRIHACTESCLMLDQYYLNILKNAILTFESYLRFIAFKLSFLYCGLDLQWIFLLHHFFTKIDLFEP
jgi:hypothetical protein